jgi:nucleotide-binding universal stress UspA family protein
MQILVATDFSPASRLALDVAGHLAHDSGARVIVLHVEPGQPSLGPAYYDIPDPNISEIARSLAALKPQSPDVAIEHRIQAGDPAEEILRLATKEGIDLIVVGSHRRRPVPDFLIGSVARALLHKSACPVLVCHETQRHPTS